MAKTKISQYDATAANNTDIDSINIAEGMAPSNVNNAIRELMAHLKDMDAGTQALTSPQLTSADIDGGTIDGVTIGGASAGAGTFTNLTATGTTTLAGASTSADITFGDSDKAIFGAGSDLQIYHDGSNSYIVDNGTGDLLIRAENNLYLKRTNSDETYLSGAVNGAVTLFHNNNPKIATSITGVDISGVLTSDGLTVDGDGSFSGAFPRVSLMENDTTNLNTTLTTAGGEFKVYTSNDALSSFASRLEINHTTGDISFFEDTGTTAKLHWSAADESLGIGTSSPSHKLHVSGTGSVSSRTFATDTTGDASFFAGNDNGQIVGPLVYGSGKAAYGALGTSETALYSNRQLTIMSDNASGIIKFATGGNTEAMRIDSSGRVGIGVVPDNTLHLLYTDNTTYTDGLDDQGLQIENNSTTTNAYTQIHFRTYNTDSYIRSINTGSGASDLAFITDANGTSEAMRIDSSGNVGIGMSSPTAVSGATALEITGTSGSEVIIGTSDTTATGNDLFGGLAFKSIDSNGTPPHYSGIKARAADTYGGASLEFYAGRSNYESNDPRFVIEGPQSVSGEAMRIDSSGNLLVGTTTMNGEGITLNASNYLYAKRSGAAAGLFDRNTNDGDIVEFRKSGSTVGSIFSSGGIQMGIGDGDTGLLFGDNIDAIMPWSTSNTQRDNATDLGRSATRFKDLYLSGSVFSGATSGGAKIVAEAIATGTTYSASWPATGGTALYMQVNSAAVGSITTTTSATAYNTSSDYRLKTDAQPMTGATDRIKQLNPVNFEWIADGTRVDGFLAHEAQAVVPEAVTGTKDAMRDEEYEVTPAVTDDDGNITTEAVMGTRSVPDYQGIDQSKLVPLLVATIKELEARITALENA